MGCSEVLACPPTARLLPTPLPLAVPMKGVTLAERVLGRRKGPIGGVWCRSASPCPSPWHQLGLIFQLLRNEFLEGCARSWHRAVLLPCLSGVVSVQRGPWGGGYAAQGMPWAGAAFLLLTCRTGRARGVVPSVPSTSPPKCVCASPRSGTGASGISGEGTVSSSPATGFVSLPSLGTQSSKAWTPPRVPAQLPWSILPPLAPGRGLSPSDGKNSIQAHFDELSPCCPSPWSQGSDAGEELGSSCLLLQDKVTL